MCELEIKCKVCDRKPHEIGEYVYCADDEGIEPEEFVKKEEGTYNPSTGKFYCTSCYVKIGMPLGKA